MDLCVHIKTFLHARKPSMSLAVTGRLFCQPDLCNTNSPRECAVLALEH